MDDNKVKHGSIIKSWFIEHAGYHEDVPVISYEAFDDKGHRRAMFSLTLPDAETLCKHIYRTTAMLFNKAIARYMEADEIEVISERMTTQQREIEDLRFALRMYAEESHWDGIGKCSFDGSLDKGRFAREILGNISRVH